MKTTVALTHKRDMRCESKLGKATLKIDSRKHRALDDSGPCPLDLLALAHGGCTGMLVAMKGAAEGLNTAVNDMDIEVTHEYDDGPPMLLKSARITFMLSSDTTPEHELKLKSAAEMCPVHTALRKDIPVVMEFIRRKR